MFNAWLRISLLVLLLVLVAVGLAACGSASSSSTSPGSAGETSSGGAAAPGSSGSKEPGGGENSSGGTRSAGKGDGTAAKPPSEPEFTPRPHHDSGGGATQYEAKGGDNSIEEFGDEPSSGEFAQAAQTLHEYLDARAARAWGAACQRLAKSAAEELVQQLGAAPGSGRPTCATTLAVLSAPLPPRVLREAAVADVGALRAEGDRGFLLFDGAHGSFFMPVRREDGNWKVTAIAASPLP